VFARNASWQETDSTAWRAALPLTLEASLALLLAIGAFLAARRLTGAFDSPLAPLPLAGTALALAAWAVALRLRLRDHRLDWLTLAVLALFAVGCSFPGAHVVDWLVWLGAVAVFGFTPRAPARSGRAEGIVGTAAANTETDAPRVLQQITRSRTALGTETIAGTVVAEFAAGERTATVHVAFCPPFEERPTIAVEAADGEAKVTQLLHHGARIEVRLPRESANPKAAAVEFLVSSPIPPAAADR
jgi:hypothetical protein